jgi:hypothetical protein
MSLIDKKNLNYFSSVEQFFLSLKDSGLALSAADYHLISQWESRGVPVRLLCRAIENAYVEFIKQSRKDTPVSLRVLELPIEEELESFSRS